MLVNVNMLNSVLLRSKTKLTPSTDHHFLVSPPIVELTPRECVLVLFFDQGVVVACIDLGQVMTHAPVVC